MPNDSGSTVRATASVEPADARLVADARAGDASAFDALVRRYYRTAFAVALANTGNRADAEDVSHDAFVRAAERLEECRQPERFAQWLCTIVRNHARNLVARHLVRHASPLEHDTAAGAENPARDAELAELRGRLIAALSVLSGVQREVVLLHDVDGRTHDEIAGLIGTSSGMSRQHLFKARQRLRDALGEQGHREHFNE